jgi:phytoene/squalene synthetase
MADPARPPAAAEPPPLTLAIREHHPTDPRWRGDLLAQSTHGRLLPLAAEPPAQAQAAPDQGDALCAESTRELLGDFAPGLLLLPATERARVRTLVVYARSLLDCAHQAGPDGDRLAAVDRWEAALERSLAAGEGPADVPLVCLRMAGENARRRWPAGTLDELAACARRRVLRPRAATAAEAESEARGLAHAVAGALLENRLNAEVNSFVGALIRLRALQGLARATASGRSPLPSDQETVPDAIERECARLRPRLLRAPRGLVELPAAYRRAGVYALLAALRLLSEIEEAGPRLLHAPPHLGTATRVGLLLRARWFGLRAGLG